MLKVLVVEDDASVASLVRNLLDSEGYGVVITTDVESAWGTAITEDPDAALIDLYLFGREAGWDVIERLRANEHFRELPIVVMTGVSGQDTIDRARALGCEYVNKPFSPATLLDRLSLVIRRAGRSPGTRSVGVVMLLTSYRIEGSVHLETDLARFSDGWEAVIHDSREFIPVTDAKVKSPDGKQTLVSSALIEVRKADVHAVFPLE
ncbi:MAG: response regulator [Actinomycetota bacterium]|nr:response regulator [Actinomycetota bacterium]